MRKTIVETEVLFHDCDPTGFAHSSRYYQWFEQGRVKLFKESNINMNFINEFCFLVIESHCKHKNSVRFGDLIIIETELVENNLTRILEFNYKIKKRLGGVEVAFGNTKHVFMSYNGKLLPRIPLSIKENFIRYLEGK